MHGRLVRPLRPWLWPAAILVALASCDGPGAAGALRPPAPLRDQTPIAMRLETSAGSVHCHLFPHRTPRAVALLTGLARGSVPFLDPHNGEIRRRAFYDGLPFFRRIAGVMIQTGCPLGDGTGHPGYRIHAELHADDAVLLQRPGAMVMAAYRRPPNRPDPAAPPPGHVVGSQWGITLRPMPHLAGQLPVVGRCRDLDILQALSRARARPTLHRLHFHGGGPAR